MAVTQFYKEWMAGGPRLWFKSDIEDDKAIVERWGYLLSWEDEDLIGDNLVGALIVLDQLSRHAARVWGVERIDVKVYLQRALIISRAVWKRACESFTIRDWIFVALPLRHNGMFREVVEVMKAGWEKLELITKSRSDAQPLLKRFIKATYTRCDLGASYVTRRIPASQSYHRMFGAGPPRLNTNDEIYTKVERGLKEILVGCGGRRRLIISLSGGVDSMILSAILGHLQRRGCYGFELVAVMINYANRDCEMEEEEFVVAWCRDVLGLELFVRRIDECKRAICMKWGMRETYETYTKRVRFQTYKEAWGGDDVPIVAFGHNHDDCFENILTNIVQQKKYDNLNGMAIDMYIDGCRLFRPMLGVSKREIYKFSERYGIPHLPNSTVSWSQRGQIRDSVRPCLEKWNDRVVDGFFQLSEVVGELHGVMMKMVDREVDLAMKSEEATSVVWTLQGVQQFPESRMFWRTLLFRLTGINISQRSLTSFIDRLQRGHIKNCNHKVSVTVHKQLILEFNWRRSVLKIVAAQNKS